MRNVPVSGLINGKRYKLVTFIETNWYRAAHICKYNDMDLAVIKSLNEQNVLEKLLDTSGKIKYFKIPSLKCFLKSSFPKVLPKNSGYPEMI